MIYTEQKVTAENLLDALVEFQENWLQIGAAFGLDEDLLDEILTNNSSSYICLMNMIQYYIQQCDTTPTWEDIARVLKRIEVAGLVQSIRRKGKLLIIHDLYYKGNSHMGQST